jgi:hypothetical protein
MKDGMRHVVTVSGLVALALLALGSGSSNSGPSFPGDAGYLRACHGNPDSNFIVEQGESCRHVGNAYMGAGDKANALAYHRKACELGAQGGCYSACNLSEQPGDCSKVVGHSSPPPPAPGPQWQPTGNACIDACGQIYAGCLHGCIAPATVDACTEACKTNAQACNAGCQ